MLLTQRTSLRRSVGRVGGARHDERLGRSSYLRSDPPTLRPTRPPSRGLRIRQNRRNPRNPGGDPGNVKFRQKNVKKVGFGGVPGGSPGGSPGGCPGGSETQIFAFLALNARYKHPRYSALTSPGSEICGKNALWSRFFSYLKNIPPSHNFFLC